MRKFGIEGGKRKREEKKEDEMEEEVERRVRFRGGAGEHVGLRGRMFLRVIIANSVQIFENCCPMLMVV